MSRAADVVCREDVQDATLTATFKNLGKADATVSLFVPRGETDGKVFEGSCRPLEGAIETFVECSVMTSGESGYEVSVYSLGGSRLQSAVTGWTMKGKGRTTILPCK